MAAPCHQSGRGHPVGFASRWRDALSALTGDAGARSLLQAHADPLARIEVVDPGCLFDVDTPADLERLADQIRMQEINEAYERMLKSEVKYRFVIDMASLKEEA